MRILAIGDFHGKFPNKFKQIIKKEKIDLIISVADYCPFSYRKLWFKHCYRSGQGLWEVIGKKKYQELVLKDIKAGEQVLKKLNNLGIPVFSVVGNLDYASINDSIDRARYERKYGKIDKWAWAEQDFFKSLIKKYENIQSIVYSTGKFKDLSFIGAYAGTNPGHAKSKEYRKHKKIIDNLFNKFKKENKQKKVIFVSHNAPYNTKLDKISMSAHKAVRGKHYGSKMVRRVIEKYQPVLAVCGHIHEGFGKDKIGKTVCVNTGAAYEGKAAIIELDNQKSVKVKFIKNHP